MEAHLKHLDPARVLERGYSIAVDPSGAIVREAAQLASGDLIELKFARGRAQAKVQNVTRGTGGDVPKAP